MKLSRGQRVQLHIDRLSVGGRGVGRVDKVVVFVPDSAPDEDLEVEITFVKKNFAEARIVQILKASPSRIKPPCPVAGVCGGCNWQHLQYEEQLTQKRALVRESLRKFSGFDVSDEASVQPVVPSPNEFRYRNRVQFHHSGARLGFNQRGSHNIVDIDDCPITESVITSLIPDFKARFSKQPAGRFEAYISEEGPVQTRGPGIDNVESSAAEEEEGGLNFSFSQVNTLQNEKLVASVTSVFKELHAQIGSTMFYDLYAGAGNFTFPLLNALPSIRATAVELSKASVDRAIQKSKSLGRDVRWIQSDVLAFLEKNPLETHSLVLIDPPRTGCDPAVMNRLANSPISHLIYVSCHPVTLSRDLKIMKDAGFELSRVQPFDMFPQTDHVETLVLLSRKTSV